MAHTTRWLMLFFFKRMPMKITLLTKKSLLSLENQMNVFFSDKILKNFKCSKGDNYNCHYHLHTVAMLSYCSIENYLTNLTIPICSVQKLYLQTQTQYLQIYWYKKYYIYLQQQIQAELMITLLQNHRQK